MVRWGLWSDAIRYVLRFVPAVRLSDGGNFLIFINLLSRIARYKPTDLSTFPQYDPYAVCPPRTRLARLRQARRCQARSDHPVCVLQGSWGSINWALVRLKAAEIVGDLFTQLLEFDEMHQLALCPAIAKPANVLLVAASSRGHSRFQKKLGRIPADALARSFLSKKRTYSSNQGTSQPGLPLEALSHLLQ